MRPELKEKGDTPHNESKEKTLSLEGRGKGEGEKPKLNETDRTRLENQNLKLSNLNLQLALLNERARVLQQEVAIVRMERDKLVEEITKSANSPVRLGRMSPGSCWRLNPDTMEFEHTPPAPS